MDNLSLMIRGFLLLVTVVAFSEGMERPTDIFFPTVYRPCTPECQQRKPGGVVWTRKLASGVVNRHCKRERAEIGRLWKGRYAPFVGSKCPCSKCKSKYVKLPYCDGCEVIWPLGGVWSTECVKPNSYCPLKCGCSGQCKRYGVKFVTVWLYCKKPVPRCVRKKVRVCTNCCCLGK